MSNRMRSLKPLQTVTTVLGLDDVELLDDTSARARHHFAREQAWTVRPRHRRFPPAISDDELARLVDECAAELCVPHCYDAYVY